MKLFLRTSSTTKSCKEGSIGAQANYGPHGALHSKVGCTVGKVALRSIVRFLTGCM
jgi:hypothetical protein